jgi:prepilin-type N-terminal cleavage/methylation domain-containing protein
MKRPTSESGVTLIELLVAVSLLSLLSVGMLFAMRVGLTAMGRTNARVIDNRRVLGVERILTQQIAGFVPAAGFCGATAQTQGSPFVFFQGDAQTMRFISTYSLQEASRGYPQILEFQVIPGENGAGVRLIVNESLYTGPFGTSAHCLGITPDPSGVPRVIWRPVAAGAGSFVIADKLARCTFLYKEERDLPQPDLWHPRWPHDFTPAAVRIDMAPLAPDPAHLHVPPVVAPFRVNRHPFTNYGDF